MAVARGRPQDAFASLRDAESCGAGPSLELRAAYAVLPFLPADTAELVALQEEFDQAPSSDSISRAYALGTVALRLGDSLGAQEALAELAARRPADPSAQRAEYLARSLRARLASPRGFPAIALARLESVQCQQGSMTPAIEVADRFLRAELLRSLGREDKPLGWYA